MQIAVIEQFPATAVSYSFSQIYQGADVDQLWFWSSQLQWVGCAQRLVTQIMRTTVIPR